MTVPVDKEEDESYARVNVCMCVTYLMCGFTENLMSMFTCLFSMQMWGNVRVVFLT